MVANQEGWEGLHLEELHNKEAEEVKVSVNQEVKEDPRLEEGHSKVAKEAFNDHLLEAVLVEVDKVGLHLEEGDLKVDNLAKDSKVQGLKVAVICQQQLD